MRPSRDANAAPLDLDSRLLLALARLRSGGSLRLATVGGSTAAGLAGAPCQENGWAALVATWLRYQAARARGTIEYASLGASCTDSAAVAMRVASEAIAMSQDIVIVDFGVGDECLDPRIRGASYESVLRQLLQAPSRPAVITLHLTQQGNRRREATDEHLRVAAHYGLTRIDFGHWVNQRAARGELSWSALYDGPTHPNGRGHEVIAAAVIERLLAAWRSPAPRAPGVEAGLPPPLVNAD